MIHMLEMKIKEIFQEIESRGFKVFFKHFLDNIWSNKRILIYKYKNNFENTKFVQNNDVKFFELSAEKDQIFFDALVSVWPKELEQYKNSEYLKSYLLHRVRNGERCIIISSLNNQIIGSVWISKVGTLLLKIGISNNKNDVTLKSFFVTHSMRGKGIGKLLLRMAVDVALNDGASDVYSFIYPDRMESVIVHQGVGFTMLGTIKTETKFFVEKTTFLETNGRY